MCKDLEVRYLCFQPEVGESGTPHLQGYIEMNKPVRFSHFKHRLDGAHWEKAKGSGDSNVAYCSKEDTKAGDFFEWGVRSRQGARTDIQMLRDAIVEGKRGRDLFVDDDLQGRAVR